MKITFVQRQIFALPGIASMVGHVFRSGHESYVLIENAERKFERTLAASQPDVIGISITSSDINWFIRTLPRVNRAVPRAFILVGGIHPTIHPALLTEHHEIDAICIGEGEEAVVELLDALKASSNSPDKKQSGPLTEIRNLHLRWQGKIYRNELRPLITNLDDYPEKREVYFKRYPQLAGDSLLQYLSSRGCPYACSFCVNETVNRIFRGLGPVHRRKSVDFTIKEIMHLRTLYPNARTVFFIDDLFLFDKEWVKKFLPRFRKEVDLPFICSAGPGTIDEEIADLLKDTGCASVEFGIETGNEQKRKDIFNKRAFTDDDFRYRIGLIKSKGIDIYAPSMFVFPTETPSDSFRTVEFCHELGVDHPFSSFLMPFPDTKIYEISLKYGVIPVGLKAEDLPGNYFINSTCDIPQRRVIENLQYLFYFFVKHPWFYRNFRWLVYLPFPLKLVRYAGLFFWFKNWKRMGYWETIRYFWRYRKSQ